MPIYEYHCQDCGEKFELLRPRSKADDPPACKYCDNFHTAREISLFAAHSDGRAVAGGGGCAGCAPSGACSTCRSN